MNYRPRGISLWDSWFCHHEGITHCIFCQQIHPEETPAGVLAREFSRESGALGHAVSKDLISWETMPTALYPGSPGSHDDYDLWNGNLIQHDGNYYLFYTSRSSVEKGTYNRISVATSKDAVEWERHPESPISTPDARWYHGEENPRPFTRGLWPQVDWRDICVVPDVEGGGYWGYVAARRPANEIASTSVIALCHSEDLIHWEQYPPCFVPDRYACVEVPEVFFLDGRWYLICLTGNLYGQHNRSSERNLGGTTTIYAVADDPRGPFEELEDNVLIGSEDKQGFAARTVAIEDRRYLLYTQSEKRGDKIIGSLSTPKILKTDVDGRLFAGYCENIEANAAETLFDATTARMLPNDGRWGSIGTWTKNGESVTGSCRTDWSIQVFDHEFPNFIFTCSIVIESARGAGLVFRLSGDDVYGGACCVILSAESDEVIFTHLVEFPRLEQRNWRIERNRSVFLRIVAINGIFDVFVNDILVLQLFDSAHSNGKFALFVEEGSAAFKDIKAQKISS